MSYQVKLEVFEGPFDLLLQLISRRQVEITEVDLAEITADFLAHLHQGGLEELDLDTATRFLVVAATLIELKAARLLPQEDREEFEDLLGDARDVLYARLLEYRAFRDVARILEHRLRRGEAYVARDVPPEGWVQRLVPDTPLPIDADGLAALAAAATRPRPEPAVDLSHIRRSYLTIREAALQVLAALPEDGRANSFGDLAADRTRGDRVVLFLALLELYKLGHLDLEQPDHRGPLSVARRTLEADLASLVDAVEEVDEVDVAGSGDADGEAPDGAGGANDAASGDGGADGDTSATSGQAAADGVTAGQASVTVGDRA
ncbi:MAG: segregation and condensation protein A [Nitriliruptoraceae bacterium]